MKSLALPRFLLLFFLLIISRGSLKANHLVATELSYTCTGTPNVYNVKLKVYRDCYYGIQFCANCPTNLSPACSLSVNITGSYNMSNSGLPSQTCVGVGFGTQTLTVVPSQSAFDVIALCNLTKSVCSNCGTRTPGSYSPGIEVYTFTGNINLSAIPSSCCLVSINFSNCCRNTSVTTMPNPTALTTYNEVVINRCATPCNSSPQYESEPDFTVPIGYETSLKYGNLIDPDGDSLSFVLGTALSGQQTPSPYLTPYIASKPFPYLGFPATRPPSLAPIGIGFNGATGVLSFTPSTGFVGPVAVYVYQWKKVNGVNTLMGITIRDHLLYGTSYTPSLNPVLKMYDSLGTASFPDSTAMITDTICAGTPQCFTLVAKDSDPLDTTYIRLGNNSSTSGNFTLTKLYNNNNRNINGPLHDSVRICFNTPSTASSTPFYVNVFATDNHCSIIGRSSMTFGYYIKPAPTVSIQKQYVDTFRYSLRYSLNQGYVKDTANFWEIESTPGSNLYIPYKNDSLINYNFPVIGNYRIRLNVKVVCGYITVPDSIQITSLSLQLGLKKNIACKGDSSGYIKVRTTGGVPPFLYKLNNAGYSSSDEFTKLTPGNYTVYVKDSFNAEKFITVSLTQPALLMSVSAAPVANNCYGDSAGRVTINTTNARPPIMYSIDSLNFFANNVFQNLKAGAYKAWAIDSNTCLKSVSFTVSQPSQMIYANNSVTHASCKGGNTGQIYVYVTGGTPSYKYKINNGSFQTSSTFANLTAGNYLIETNDFKNCKALLNLTVKEPDTALTLDVIATPKGCPFSFSNGSAYLIAKGGIKPYLYGYSGGPQASATNPISGLSPGNYSLYVKDSNNCTVSTIKNISVFTSFNARPVITHTSCPGKTDGSVLFNPENGTPPYKYYSMSQSVYYNNPATSLAKGSYIFMISDTTGCSEQYPVTINNTPLFTISFQSNKVSCSSLANGWALATPNGGKKPYLYTWNTNPVQTTPDAYNLSAGWAKVQIADSNLCTSIDSVQILAKTVFQDEEICAVTIDSLTNFPVVIWNKTTDKGTSNFEINVSNGAASTKLGSTQFGENTLFTDNSVLGTYGKLSGYTLVCVDSCGGRSNPSLPHRALYLSKTGLDSFPHFSIQPYLGSVSALYYRVFKKTTGAFVLIDSVPSSQYSYTDRSWKADGPATYMLELIPSNVCTSKRIYSNFELVSITGIPVTIPLNHSFTLYPNPSTGAVSVQSNNRNFLISRIEIRNLQGAVILVKVLDKPAEQYNLNLEILANGTYLMQVWNKEGESGTLPCIINH